MSTRLHPPVTRCKGYRVLFETGTLTVSPAEVTITAGAAKIYGEVDPALVTIAGMKNDEDPQTVLSYTVFREEERMSAIIPSP